MSRIAIALLVLLALLLGGVPALAGDVTDTWKKRTEFNPNSIAGPVPVVVYAHGCSGPYARPELTVDTNAWAQVVTGAGWRFVVPDSWARGVWSRPDGCRLGSVSSALKLRDMRVEEAGYAVSRLQEDPAVDKNRIVLFGHSEGAWTLANSPLPPGITGLILSGWTCHQDRLPAVVGLATPPALPLLAIEFSRDSFLSTQGRCSEFFGGRDRAREVILPGEGHNAGGVEAARQAVAEFLGRLR